MSAWGLLAAIAPALVSWAVITAIRGSSWATRLADRPNERSLHSLPTPRVGGLGVMAGALPFAFLLGDDAIRVLAGCAVLLALVSLADDVESLPIQVRLPAHAAAALVAVLVIAAPNGTQGGLGVVEAAAAILAIIWMTNLYNFMDGSDGLAGGMAAIGFGAFAIAAWQANALPLALTTLAIASASAGFLVHNFPPARVFLGDAGSIPLGFLAGALGLHGVFNGAWPAWFPVLVFSPFIVDATLTLARRMVRGEPFWKAHRSHFYQRLVLAGWTRRKLAWASYALMAAAAASALAGRTAEASLAFGIILFWAAAYLLFFIAIAIRTRAA
jgi:UDP-GlcNAc:undecaprenyl-phosphate/decaprenyl-phosphate GlcNAc-1-phosphate transferase